MEEDLISWLRSDATLSGLLGSFNGRSAIDYVTRPDKGTLPAIVINKVSPGKFEDQDGVDTQTAPRVQFSIFAETYGQTRLAFRRLAALIESGATHRSTVFERGYNDSDRDLDSMDQDGGDRVFHLAADFFIPNRPA